MGNITIFGAQPDALQMRPAERKMLEASNGKRMADYDKEKFYELCARLSERICNMVGLKKSDYSSVKLVADFLHDYYSGMTFREVLTAFEICMAGELDAYLPKTRDGLPDKNHYQSYSIEYVSRILNAYKKRRGDFEAKRIESLPKSLPDKTDEEKAGMVRSMLDKIKRIFLLYKYTGRMELTQMNELTIYRELDKVGLAVPIEVRDEDKRAAVIRLNKKARNGVFNEFVGSCIRNLQERHPYVPDEAIFIARSRAVRESFDEIIDNEVQLTDLI